MPILVGLIVLIALAYGAVVAFESLSVHFGLGVAIVVAVIVALAILAVIARWWQRRRDVAPNIHDGDWTHQVKGPWGQLRLASGKRLCEVTVAGASGAYIFADLQGAQPERAADAWQIRIKVKDAKTPEWCVPMTSEREAKRWARIVGLAVEQKL